MAATRNVLRPFFVIMNTGYYGDRYGAVRNDTFQLGGSAFGGLGGVQNGWERFYGGEGEDRIYVSPTSGYSWTAIMIADNGLSSIEKIQFNQFSQWPVEPVYFAGKVDFSSVKYMDSSVTIYGRANDNTFIGGRLGETVQGDGGNDTLYGNGGNDRLFGDSTSANRWVADLNAAGNDKLYGGDGNDYLNGQGGNDLLYGDGGDDSLYGGTGTDQLSGGDGADKLFGEAGNDQLRGGAGNDVLDGGAGSDLIEGGDGENVLWGGADADTFYFSVRNAQDTIKDFQLGSDRIRFDTAIADDFADLMIADGVNGHANISVDGLQIMLSDVSAASLVPSMFEFGLLA
ncbi:calcium-binding protein [Agrobacterium salinitolerans]|uniref:calcium-binding protein n=1 Tax=Agrobacterium salinitolerans TaxID=1183413 RepID=UPI00098F593A|nr:calcium-binding protein [Agrobacterium salinitolerans]OOO27095.1 hypothetical protein BS627_08955 [Agrobacterium salinitolerans]PNQ25254.1 calcium-binding protein [Rhizobium sp. YIC5082]